MKWSIIAAGLAVVPPQADAEPCQLTNDGVGTVTEILDGDTLFIDDGTQIRLVGIQAPKLPLGRKGFKSWPLAEEAKNELVTGTIADPLVWRVAS